MVMFNYFKLYKSYILVKISLVCCLSSSIAFAKSMNYQVTNYDNGMVLVTAPNGNVPLVTINLNFNVGSAYGTKKTSGLVHFLEHMFFRKSDLFDSEIEFKRFVEKYGMTYNGYTTTNNVNFNLETPSMYLDQALKLTGSVARTMIIDKTGLDQERTVVINELYEEISEVYFAFIVSNHHLLYGAQSYKKHPLGLFFDVIKNATSDDLLKLRDKIIAPSNTTLVLTGDVDLDKTTKLVDKYFQDWQNPKGYKFPEKTKLRFELKESKVYNFSHPRQTNATIYMFFQSPYVGDDEKKAHGGNLLSALLDHKGSKYYNKFIKTGKHLYSGLSVSFNKISPKSVVYGSVEPSKVEQTIEDILSEIKLMASDGYFTKEQLSDIKRQISMRYKLEADDLFDFSETFNDWIVLFGLNYYRDYLKVIQEITLEEIKDYVKAYLLDKNYLASILYNTEDAADLKVNLNGDQHFKKNFSQLIDIDNVVDDNADVDHSANNVNDINKNDRNNKNNKNQTYQSSSSKPSLFSKNHQVNNKQIRLSFSKYFDQFIKDQNKTIKSFSLENGIKVVKKSIVSDISYLRFVIWWNAASTSKSDRVYAKLVPAMLLNGTKSYPKEQFYSLLEKHSISFKCRPTPSCYTGNISLSCAVAVQNQFLDHALSLTSSVFLEPEFDEKDFDVVKHNTSVAINKSCNSDLFYLTNNLINTIFYPKDFRYYLSTEQLFQSLEQSNLEQMSNVYEKFRNGQRMQIFALTSIDQQSLSTKLDDHFGKFPSWSFDKQEEMVESPDIGDIPLIIKYSDKAEDKDKVDGQALSSNRDISSVSLLLKSQLPNIYHPDSAGLSLLYSVVEQLLHDTVRIKSGLSYHIQSEYVPGFFGAGVIYVPTDKPKLALEKIIEVIETIKTKPVDDDLLSSMISSAFVTNMHKAASAQYLAYSYVSSLLYFDDPLHNFYHSNRLAKYHTKDVMNLAKKYLGNFKLAVFGPKELIGDDHKFYLDAVKKL